MENVLRVALEVITMRRNSQNNELHLEQHPDVTEARLRMGGGLLLRGTHWGDFALLQSHADELAPKDRIDWLSAIKFFQGALRNGGWPLQDIPPTDDLLHVLGRILSNNFGLYGSETQSVNPWASVSMARKPQSTSAVSSTPAMQSQPAAAQHGGERSRPSTSRPEPDHGQFKQLAVAAARKEIGPASSSRAAADGAPAEQVATYRTVKSTGQQSIVQLRNVEEQKEEQVDEYAEDDDELDEYVDDDDDELDEYAEDDDELDEYAEDDDELDEYPQLPVGYVRKSAGAPAPVQGWEDIGPSHAGMHKQTARKSGHAPAAVQGWEDIGPSHAGMHKQTARKSGQPPRALPSSPDCSEFTPCESSETQSSLPIEEENSSVSCGNHTQTNGDQVPCPDSSQPCTSADPQAGPSSQAVPSSQAGLSDTAPAKDASIGRIVYSTASYFNHSCEPNCMVSKGRLACITALHDIQQGEPLTITYIDLEQPRASRQSHLQRNFFFHCTCSRCEREAQQGWSDKCYYEVPGRGTADGGAPRSFAPKKRGRKARVKRI